MARRRRSTSWPQTVGPKGSRYTLEGGMKEHGAMIYVGKDGSVSIEPKGGGYKGVISYSVAYHGRPIESYTGTKQEMLDLMTAREHGTQDDREGTVPHRREQEGPEGRPVEAGSRGTQSARKGTGRQPEGQGTRGVGSDLWNPRHTKKRR